MKSTVKDLLLASSSSNRAPPQAAAAGFNTLTFASKFAASELDLGATGASGFKWYPWSFFGSNADPTKIQPTSEGVKLLGDTTGPNGQISSVVYKGPGLFAGTAFGGGGYFEAILKFNPADVIAQSFAGWPSWWMMALQHMVAMSSDQWSGQAAGFRHFAEVDVFEYDQYQFTSDQDDYGAALHDWYGLDGSYSHIDPPYSLVRRTGIDYTQWHKYGFLWVPATATTKGYCQFFCDDQLVSTTRSAPNLQESGITTYKWGQFTTQAPPPGPVLTTTRLNDVGSIEGKNVRVVFDPSLLSSGPTGQIKLSLQFGGCTGGVLDSAFIGTSAAGAGSAPGSPHVFAGTLGAGLPTGWNQLGAFGDGLTLIDPGTVNGVTTYAEQIRESASGGYQGIQLNGSATAGQLYEVSAWLRIPTGVTASDCFCGTGGVIATLASASALNAQAKDTWVKYSTTVSPDSTFIGFWNPAEATGTGFDIALPEWHAVTDPDFAGDQVQLTFNNGQASVQVGSGNFGIDSDHVPFTFDPTKKLVLSMHLSGSSVALRNNVDGGGAAFYTQASADESGVTTVSTSGYLAQSGSVAVSSVTSLPNPPYDMMAVLDQQHLVLHLGTGPSEPMTVQSVRVWQANKDHNLQA